MATGQTDAIFGDGATAQPRAQRTPMSLPTAVAARLHKPHNAPSENTNSADSGIFTKPALAAMPVQPQAIADSNETRSTLDPRQPEFDAFFQRYEQPLYGYLRRMLPSEEVAMELSQEAFFRAWQHFAELQTYDRQEAWLYRVATNLAISHLRRKKSLSFAQIFKRTGSEGEQGESAIEYEFLADPLDMEQQTADRDLIERTLQRLPERQRAALLLRAVYGLSCEEIGAALGISVPNVRQTLSRGRERFRKLYTTK